MGILLCMACGKQNKEIANELNISIGTVEQHKAHMIQRTTLEDTKGLTKFAILNKEIIFSFIYNQK